MFHPSIFPVFGIWCKKNGGTYWYLSHYQGNREPSSFPAACSRYHQEAADPGQLTQADQQEYSILWTSYSTSKQEVAEDCSLPSMAATHEGSGFLSHFFSCSCCGQNSICILLEPLCLQCPLSGIHCWECAFQQLHIISFICIAWYILWYWLFFCFIKFITTHKSFLLPFLFPRKGKARESSCFAV